MSPPEASTTAGTTAADRPTVSRLQAYSAGGAVLFVLCFAWLIRGFYMDDAYIGFQYLKSLLAGHGFVFFPGAEPVEGVTNIGWQIVLAPLALFVGPQVAAKAAGLILALVALRLTARIGIGIAGTESPGAVWLVPVLLLATSFDFLYFAFAGMETALLAVLLLAMAAIARRSPHSWSLPALGAAACLTHPEAILVVPLYLALALVGGFGPRRRLLALLAALAGLMLAVTVLRYGYFGDVVPNTFHAKSGGLFLKIDGAFQFLTGQNINIAFPVSGVVALPFLVFGALRVHRASPPLAAMLAAITATGIAFGIYSREDWSELARYFAPYLPAALVLFWFGLAEVVDRVGLAGRESWRPRLMALAATALVVTQLYGILTGMARMESYPGYVLAGHPLVAPARWIRDAVPPDAVIATRRIGALAFHSERRVFDYVYGLTERDVASQVAARGSGFDAADDDLAALWTDRAPDYILEDDDVMAEIIEAAGGSPETFVLHGIAYRVMQSFAIGSNRDWVLAGRVDLP